VFVQITGLEEHDPDIYDEMYQLIERAMNRITPIAMPQLLTMHFSESHKAKEGRHYTLRARLSTSSGLFFSQAFDYDSFRALNTVLEHLDKQVVKEKERALDRRDGH
jgi:ribosome-associated translation inhibitor RaiA